MVNGVEIIDVELKDGVSWKQILDISFVHSFEQLFSWYSWGMEGCKIIRRIYHCIVNVQ